MVIKDDSGVCHYRQSLLVISSQGISFGLFAILVVLSGVYILCLDHAIRSLILGTTCIVCGVLGIMVIANHLWNVSTYRASLYSDRVEWMQGPKQETLLYDQITAINHYGDEITVCYHDQYGTESTKTIFASLFATNWETGQFVKDLRSRIHLRDEQSVG